MNKIALVFVLLAILASCSGKPDQVAKKSNAPQNILPREVPEVEEKDWFQTGEQVSSRDLQRLLLELQSGERPFDFYAVFTEPFWTIYFFKNQALFMTSEWDAPELVPLEYPFNEDTDEVQTLRFSMFEELWEMKVTKTLSTDGMSEITYPYKVEYGSLSGAGATRLMRE